MGRKNINAVKTRRQRKLAIPNGHHFLYSTHEFGEDATVVRYMGEQDGDSLLCFIPDGFSMWIHIHHLTNVPKTSSASA